MHKIKFYQKTIMHQNDVLLEIDFFYFLMFFFILMLPLEMPLMIKNNSALIKFISMINNCSLQDYHDLQETYIQIQTLTDHVVIIQNIKRSS